MSARYFSLGLLATGILLAGASQADSSVSHYIFTDLGTLGGSSSSANAINNVGQIAGWASTPGDAARHATLWNGATTTDLGTAFLMTPVPEPDTYAMLLAGLGLIGSMSYRRRSM